MRVMTLGAIHEAQPLPSSTAVGEVLGGEPGGVLHVLTSTLLRAFLIAPGVALSGARGGRLVAGALVGSLSVTVGVFLWHGLYPVSRVIDSNGGGGGGGGRWWWWHEPRRRHPRAWQWIPRAVRR